MGRELIQHLKASKLLPGFVLVLALGILGSTIYLGTDHMRRRIRERMVNHDGEILDAVAQAQEYSAERETNLNGHSDSAADHLALALRISQIKEGVLAVRLYDAR